MGDGFIILARIDVLLRLDLTNVPANPALHLNGDYPLAWAKTYGEGRVFYGSFALVVTSSVRIAGVLLVFSYLIVPSALSGLFERFPGLSLAVPDDELQPLPTFIMNGHRSLPVRLNARVPAGAGAR